MCYDLPRPGAHVVLVAVGCQDTHDWGYTGVPRHLGVNTQGWVYPQLCVS